MRMFATNSYYVFIILFVYSVLKFTNCSKFGLNKKFLKDEPECIQDITRLCGGLPSESDDMFVLECIQSFKANELSSVNEKCQHLIWEHTMYLIDNINLRNASSQICGRELQSFNCEMNDVGSYLTCMVEHKDSIQSAVCRAYIQRLEWIAFTDFRIIAPFAKYCESDIKQHTCGRVKSAAEEKLAQGSILACLQQNIDEISPLCRKAIIRVSEIQSDDFKLDRQLYLACQSEQLRFCPGLDRHPGNGAVYECLLQHKLEKQFSSECRKQLLRREKLIAQDYKVSKGLSRACRDDIKLYHCRRDVSDDKEIRLAQILLCLEAAMHNGSRLAKDCQSEMFEHRKILLEDYRLSPEIVSRCSEDISHFCNNLEVGGKTIHCLMEHTQTKKRKSRVSVECQRALEMLVKETDAGEDWRVDPVLHEACKPVVDKYCNDIIGGDARVMSCLMERVGTNHMTNNCETALLQIQYFVARDFKLDPQLYRQCREDAIKICHAKKAWADDFKQMDPERGPLVLSCLYRYAYHPLQGIKLKPYCLGEIRRVMRQRAVTVDLQPEIEEACLDDLAANCLDKTNKGEEMLCLQDKLEYLSAACQIAVSNFTEEQMEHVELNPVISFACRREMEKHCEAELATGKDEGDLMECLIEHKNEPDFRANPKCRAVVEHYQLISLKNYRFTHKFKEACRVFVLRYCPTSRSKNEVIACLSEQVRNDTLKDAKPSIPRECRQQLRAQLFQQREDYIFDPHLKKSCTNDIRDLCSDIEPGSARILECLQTNKKRLTDDCHHAIFNVEKQDLFDSSGDYMLITTCRQMINEFCHGIDLSQSLECLKRYKDEKIFDPKCRGVVVRRMIEQNQDYRFNPLLQKNCHLDISKFCTEIVAQAPQDSELEGKVIQCLKKKFREKKLSGGCETQVTSILREAALNYKLNPLLAKMCENEINTMCPGDDEDSYGTVEECLKQAFLNHRIQNPACRLEVVNIIEEGKADIHVDPLLHQACGVDVSKFCGDIPQGNGRHIQCLQGVLADPTKSLNPECHSMLTKRMEMFKNAAQGSYIVEPQSLQDLYTHVSNSSANRYFLMMLLTFVGFIFVIGLFCGRASRRTLMMKNK